MSIKTNLFNAMTGQGKSFEDTYPGAVRGGTQIPDYAPKLGRGNATELTVDPVEMTVGGDPRVALFNKLYIDHAPQITAKITESLTNNDKGLISNYSGGVGYEQKGFSANFGATYQQPVGEKSIAASRAFDVMYAEKVLEWANRPQNRNGAKIQIEGGEMVAYDKAMVDEIRTNATNLLERIRPRPPGSGVRGSVGDEELPSQSVAQATDRSAGVVASATSERSGAGALSPDFRSNPTVQQVTAALERNGVAPENQNPSLVAGLAGAAANLSRVQDVALTPQMAFVLDRDKFDPAANRASVGMDVANKPFEDVWQKASAALQQAQAPAVLAQAQGQDLEQKQSARTM
jgi:hypothetical protein